MKQFAFILLYTGLSFAARSQTFFNFSDTTFTLGQKHRLIHMRYSLGGHNQLLTDSLALLELDSVVQFLEKNRNLSVEVGVHTDHRGSDTMNLKMTQFRSEYVRNYLVSRGISSSRVIARGYGESQLIVPEKETDNYKKTDKLKWETLHQRNRRTELKIIRV